MAIRRSTPRRPKGLNAKKKRRSPRLNALRTKCMSDCNRIAPHRHTVKTRSMKKKEKLQLSWIDLGNSYRVFNPSSLESRPPNPYRIGYRFIAQAHIPEKELPATWKCCPSGDGGSSPDWSGKWSRNWLLSCLEYPPLPGAIGTDSIELEIQGWMRVGQENGAQLFTVCSNGRSAPQNVCSSKDIPRSTLMAKVYDPLYTEFRYWCTNWVHCVDEWYIREANAYQALLDLQGIGIPKCYGSYSLSLPVPLQASPNGVSTGSSREVRLILIELIKGITMSDFERPHDLPQKVRKNIIRSMIHLESQIYHRGIDIGPLKPRNVILREPLDELSESGVVFVDFEHAFNRCDQEKPPDYCWSSSRQIPNPKRFTGRYISPLLRWKNPPERFLCWIDWIWKPWLHEQFRHTAQEITPEIREVWGNEADL